MLAFPPVSPEDMRAGQMMTAAAMAAFVGARFLPRHAQRIRMAVLALYLAAIAMFVVRWLAE